ncbi:MAG TPA: aldolase/citrate lyase family protein [Candidatus Lokiarchaeia archaeon]|nr:aldolase/citrate lyase family protein [Candidatus Lokiarchaeia archaeon]
MVDSLRGKMKTGQNITGIMVQDFACPALVALLADCGFDFIVIDQEHGPASNQDLEDVVIAARNLDLAVIVRTTKNAYEYIARVLDMGADGVMVPHIDTVEEAKRVVDCTKYPPIGNRSHGMRHYLSKFGPVSNSAEYIQVANENTTIFLQAESTAFINNMDAILSDPNVDGIIVGPSDFTMSMGIIGQYENKLFVSNIDAILQSCKQNEKYFGIHLSKIDLMEAWKNKGMNILLFSSASNLLHEKAVEILARLKA